MMKRWKKTIEKRKRKCLVMHTSNIFLVSSSIGSLGSLPNASSVDKMALIFAMMI